MEQYQRLRVIPAVHEVLVRLEQDREFRPILANDSGTKKTTHAVRVVLQRGRDKILSQSDDIIGQDLNESEAVNRIWTWILEEVRREVFQPRRSLRRVINATGVVLHTNCGRAVLAPEVAEFVAVHARYYSNLELNVATGERGSRYTHVEELLCTLTGAEAAMVVNNNAAAVLLAVNTLAKDKEVVVSRGELVEIGGSFRIPEVLKAGGAKLVEVGSTNKTWVRDYSQAISSETAMLMKVHTSNFRIEGFTQAVSGSELAALGEQNGLPVVEDLGSGSFFDGADLGFPVEPTIAQSVKAGLSLVTFSGDKLLGGPQAGIIVGEKAYIERLRANQLTRALRIDKLTLAALEGTLRIYERGSFDDIPVWQMLRRPASELRAMAEKMAAGLEGNSQLKAEVSADYSQVGGGAWPTVNIPTWICAVRPIQGRVEDLDKFLRAGEIPILARIQRDWVFFDPRTLLAGDTEEVIARLWAWERAD